ncbi:glycosyltransferase family 4 protein [Actinomadura atramentaria]|uniref:glycosyltransferase family 4 protein n=1 Tax=Actinomadura atramentaria TaxID=1990 RepID=UPI00036CF526|nr:glycosyltransferase family 4 protein [Actinomadura atramentaria]
MTTIAFVLLSYSADVPAGLERSVAALAAGLRELGHRAVIVTAAGRASSADTDVVALDSVRLADPATEDDLLAALRHPEVADEVSALLKRLDVDIACWADASWGLGYLAPAPAGVRTALYAAVMRTDPLFDEAAAQASVVVTTSPFMLREAAAEGYDTARWAAVPNALLTSGKPPGAVRRELLRRAGPVRIVARAEPHKGVRELIEAIPASTRRPVEIVLAAAGFEYWPGMQDDVIDECRRAARTKPNVRVLPALPWRAVPDFFAGGCLTIISTTSPESWCNAAAEALSAGTPVVAYDFGHVPDLVGRAGVMVPPGRTATELWTAANSLLRDRRAYRAASRAAPGRVAAHTPSAAAAAFLDAVTRHRTGRSRP